MGKQNTPHMGRILSLQPSLTAASRADVDSLVSLAEQELAEGNGKNAAELLRAAEHISFATLASGHAKQPSLSSFVEEAVKEEYERLAQKAAEHWDHADRRHPAVSVIYKSSLQGAKRALAAGGYPELVRAAAALAEIEKHGPKKLAAGRSRLELTASR
jgi:hypothetical protein